MGARWVRPVRCQQCGQNAVQGLARLLNALVRQCSLTHARFDIIATLGTTTAIPCWQPGCSSSTQRITDADHRRPLFNATTKGTTLKTALLDGKTPANFDQNIIGNLLLDVASSADVRQEKMLIGVRNENGDIYRLIGATKVNSFNNAVEELEDLGLVDELKDAEAPVDGCDAIFRLP